MKRKFVWNLFLVVVLNLLIKPFYILGIDAEVINRVGASVYGNYFALINFSFLLNIILDLGITNYNVKNISQYNQLLDKHFSGIITLRLFLVLIYLFVTFCIGLFVGYDWQQFKILFLLAVNQSLVAFILYMRSNLAGLHLFFQDSIVSVLDRTLLIIICSVLLWSGIFDAVFQIEWFVYAQTTSYLITLLFCFFLVVRQTTKFKFNWNKRFALIILKNSLPYALLIFLMTIYYRVDSIMLERLVHDNSVQAGIYAQAYRFFEASNMLAYLFAALLLPIFSKMLQLGESVYELVDCSFRILMGCVLILSVFCCFFSYEIMNFRYHDYVLESSNVLAILMLCFICVSSTYIFGTLLTANGSLFYLNIVAGLGVVLNIGLNLVLIPQNQALGSALASLITQFLTGLAQIFLCVYVFKLNLWRPFIRVLIFLFGILLCVFFIEQLALLLYSKFLIYFFLSGVLLFVTGLVKLSDFNMLSSNQFKIK